MTLFLWKRSYEIGAAEIDMQHRHLVGFINQLADAMMEGHGHRAVPRLIDELTDYIQLHFTAEEDAMRKAGFPDFEEHTRQHEEMTRVILAFRARLAKEHQLDPRELLTFLCDWFKQHIVERDREFGLHLRRSREGWG